MGSGIKFNLYYIAAIYVYNKNVYTYKNNGEIQLAEDFNMVYQRLIGLKNKDIYNFNKIVKRYN